MKRSEATRKAISEALKGRVFSAEHRKNIGLSSKGRIPANKGKPRSQETRDKIALKLKGTTAGRKNPMYGKVGARKGMKTSPETRRKQRISHIAHAEKTGQKWLGIGKNETQLLDQQEKIDNCKILRQYRIKDLGYFVDGYDPINNRVYEVYERAHDAQVQKDFERETEICNHLSCDFVILWDR